MISGFYVGVINFFFKAINFDANYFALKNREVIYFFYFKDFFKQVCYNWNILEYPSLFHTGLARIEYIIEKAR